MNLTFAVIMCGGSVHGRYLLHNLIHNNLLPKLIIIETGTARSKKHKDFLNDGNISIPSIEYLLENISTKIRRVSNYNGKEAIKILRNEQVDFGINGGADIFSDELLKSVKNFFINAHPGLLPDYRGLDPVLWTLLEGGNFGATLHKIDKDIDSGEIFYRKKLEFTNFSNIVDLRLECIRLCSDLVVSFLKKPNTFKPIKPFLSPEQVRGRFNMENYHLVEKAFEERRYESLK